MIALVIAAALAAPGDPQHEVTQATVELTPGEASQVSSFVTATWPGNPIGTVTEVECWTTAEAAGECQIKATVVAMDGSGVIARNAAGWVFGPGDIVAGIECAADDCFRMQSPAAPAPGAIGTFLDNVFGPGSGSTYRRLRIFRDAVTPSTIWATLTTQESSSVPAWYAAWKAGTVGPDILGLDP